MTSPIGLEQVFFFLFSFESIESRKSLREAESAGPREGRRDPHIRSTAYSGKDLKKNLFVLVSSIFFCVFGQRGVGR